MLIIWNKQSFASKCFQNFVFQRPAHFMLPSLPEDVNLNIYYNFIIPKNQIEIFAAMLAERRIVFTSAHLDRLSACVQAANALLYPMVWEHIFIPILPMPMRDMLGATMPFLIGVPTTDLQDVSKNIKLLNFNQIILAF